MLPNYDKETLGGLLMKSLARISEAGLGKGFWFRVRGFERLHRVSVGFRISCCRVL